MAVVWAARPGVIGFRVLWQGLAWNAASAFVGGALAVGMGVACLCELRRGGSRHYVAKSAPRPDALPCNWQKSSRTTSSRGATLMKTTMHQPSATRPKRANTPKGGHIAPPVHNRKQVSPATKSSGLGGWEFRLCSSGFASGGWAVELEAYDLASGFANR